MSKVYVFLNDTPPVSGGGLAGSVTNIADQISAVAGERGQGVPGA